MEGQRDARVIAQVKPASDEEDLGCAGKFLGSITVNPFLVAALYPADLLGVTEPGAVTPMAFPVVLP